MSRSEGLLFVIAFAAAAIVAALGDAGARIDHGRPACCCDDGGELPPRIDDVAASVRRLPAAPLDERENPGGAVAAAPLVARVRRAAGDVFRRRDSKLVAAGVCR